MSQRITNLERRYVSSFAAIGLVIGLVASSSRLSNLLTQDGTPERIWEARFVIYMIGHGLVWSVFGAIMGFVACHGIRTPENHAAIMVRVIVTLTSCVALPMAFVAYLTTDLAAAVRAFFIFASWSLAGAVVARLLSHFAWGKAEST